MNEDVVCVQSILLVSSPPPHLRNGTYISSSDAYVCRRSGSTAGSSSTSDGIRTLSSAKISSNICSISDTELSILRSPAPGAPSVKSWSSQTTPVSLHTYTTTSPNTYPHLPPATARFATTVPTLNLTLVIRNPAHPPLPRRSTSSSATYPWTRTLASTAASASESAVPRAYWVHRSMVSLWRHSCRIVRVRRSGYEGCDFAKASVIRLSRLQRVCL